MEVRVYWNLKYGRWTVKAQHGTSKKWKVIGYAKRLNIRAAALRVQTGAGMVQGDLEGVLWDQDLPMSDRTDYTSWLASDRAYWAYGTTKGTCITYRPDLDATSWLAIGPAKMVWDGTSESIRFADMVCMEAAGIKGARRGNVWAFDPLQMPA